MYLKGGNVAHITAIVTIFFAVKLGKAELPEWIDFILVAYVIFHVLIHLLLSVRNSNDFNIIISMIEYSDRYFYGYRFLGA